MHKHKNLLVAIQKWALLFMTIFLAAVFVIAVLTNTRRLRNSLFLDSNIHSWSIPQNGQVVQRAENGKLSLQISGRIGLRVKSVEVAIVTPRMTVIKPEDWKILNAATRMTYFTGKTLVPPGWLKVFIRSKGQSNRLINGIQVGVGEVFIVAGQSNASGGSQTLFLAESENVRSGQFQENGTLLWKHGDDPQVFNAGGSLWPLLGDMLTKELGVPIAFINVAKGNTSIRDWSPEGKLFQQLLKAIEFSKPYGVRAILWQQGEWDGKMQADEYYQRISKMINETQKATKTDIKIPWLVARATYSNGNISDAVAKAQKQTWEDGLALEGPNTDSLGISYREPSNGVHLNEAGTREAARLWFNKINNAFFKSPIMLTRING